MRIFLVLVGVLFFLACGERDGEFSKSEKPKEKAVQIEQGDAKIDLNETNLPLPVEDGS